MSPLASTPLAHKPRRGEEHVLRIDGFDERGRGHALQQEQHFHVRRVLPGDLVRARVLRRRGNHVEAVALERLEHSPATVTARCAHFGSCGGCGFQDLAYEVQLEGLHELVRAAFAARGLLDHIEIEPVIGASERWHYRNKMEFTFSNRRWIDPREPPHAPDSFALGLHATALYSKVIDIHSCSIQDPRADRIVGSVRELALERGLQGWDVRTHRGLLRHLVVRTSRRTGEILIDLVTADGAEATIEEFARAILARHPEITTLVHNVNTRKAATAIGERERVLHGPGVLRETLAGVTFAISANSFFQTNTAQAERLFEIVREESRLSGSEVVYDLYCGTGAIALVLARHAQQVFGFEQVASAITDARRNAELNSIANACFFEGDVEIGLLQREQLELPIPDVCIVDPPRAGLHRRVTEKLLSLGARRIVYVSCNQRTAACDVEALVRGGYRIERVRPIDLFPHTPHVECVVSLARDR